MGIIAFVLLGLIAGALAKAIHPGADQPAGVLGTLAVGILGALAGGLIASAAGLGGLGSFFDLETWLVAVGGALLVLVVVNATTARGRRSQPRQA
jgi:uncharacterized membrane protein YeaQ/YmgE (transglycosylase-associated protein family)